MPAEKTYLMPFEKEDYMVRLAKIKESMQEKGMDVLFLSDPANICYVTGYNSIAYYTPMAAIVSLEEEMPYFIGRYMDAFAGVVKTTYLDEQHVFAYPDIYVQNPEKHAMEYMAEVLKELGLDKKVIGVENDAYYFSPRAMDALAANLPDATFADAYLLVNWVRIVKSDAEVDLIRKAGVIAGKAMQAGFDAINVGARQCDVVSEIFRAMIHGTEEFGGDLPAAVPFLPYGEYAGSPHITWNDSKYDNNTSVYIELAGCYQRYHAPLARTVSIGQPSQIVSDCAKAAIEGLQNALAAVKPGVTCGEISEVYYETAGKYGFEKESRIGYPCGLNFPVDWVEHTASLRKGDTTVLEPNMVFHMIPGMYYDDFGVTISQTFRVTETGFEKMVDFPYEICIK